jgi:ParB-like chromosome segregation protein Spo0J
MVNGSAIPVETVVFRDDLYPRLETSATTVQKYAEDLDVLPPIEINQNHELIDGWHRWTAHKKAKAETIRTFVTKTKSDGELLELAIERNATHGLQLSQADKRDMARRVYAATPERDRDAAKKRLAGILSVSERTIRDWLSRMDKDAKESRDRKIFDLWLACWTQEEIASEVSISQAEVAKSIPNGESADLNKTQLAAAEHAADFDPPLYNIWKQQEKTNGSGHFGNSEVRWLDNLLYLYTQPFDIVIDPFAGGGSTIDLCRKRFRRYFVSDRLPIVEREKDIRKHDVIVDGLPKPPQWKDVRLVYLDPPYWKQAEGQYSNAKTDLGNMPLEAFTDALAGIINGYAKKLETGYIALLMQPTQWKAPERRFTDHVGDMLRAVKLPVDMRYSVPYESQQCTAQMVEWAKKEKRTLVLTRELVVWKV